MNSDKLDETDSGILHLLQKDARNNSAADIAEEVGVTANTVRNRIQRLQERNILDGYVPLINYEQVGFQLKVIMNCTAPIPDRTNLAQEALAVNGVTHVREVMTGQRNIHVIAVASEGDRITEIANRLHDIGLTIESEELVKNEYTKPFRYFGENRSE